MALRTYRYSYQRFFPRVQQNTSYLHTGPRDPATRRLHMMCRFCTSSAQDAGEMLTQDMDIEYSRACQTYYLYSFRPTRNEYRQPVHATLQVSTFQFSTLVSNSAL
jgi:hypothetical protein